MDIKALEKKAAEVRIGIVKAIHNAGSGHPGGSLSAADIVTALYFAEMNVNADEPEMKGRDKFILSKGHAGPCLLYTSQCGQDLQGLGRRISDAV